MITAEDIDQMHRLRGGAKLSPRFLGNRRIMAVPYSRGRISRARALLAHYDAGLGFCFATLAVP